MAKSNRKASARKSSSTKSKRNARTRVFVKFDDKQKIKVVGEHNRHEKSRYGIAYEQLRKTSTVAAFRAKRKADADAQELLRAATKDGYIKVA